MATLLSRSSSLMDPPTPSGSTPAPVVPQRRRREPEEVIDVDELDDVPTATSSRGGSAVPRPMPRRARTDNSHSHPTASTSASANPRFQNSAHDPIILTDSDDEDDDMQLMGTSTGPQRSNLRRPNHSRPSTSVNSTTSTPRTRFFSPPPRELPVVVIPPVPQVPRQYAALQSLPRRAPFASAGGSGGAQNRGTPPLAGVIRPREQPYGFEAAIRNRHPHPPPQQHRNEEGEIRPAARSYHTPHMGFGGALITSNRARVEQERRDRRANPTTAALDLLALGIPMGAAEDFQAIEALLLGDEQLGPRLFIPRDRMERLRRQREEDREYKEMYTHPRPREPGFVFDFAPREEGEEGSGGMGRLFPRTSKDEPIVIDDSDEEPSADTKPDAKPDSKHTLSTLLVCARCMDPLVLSANLTSEELRGRRIWGLRCGHLIDEKCLDEIGVPPILIEDDQDVKVDRKGKGKARAVDLPPLPALPSDDDLSTFMPGSFPSSFPENGIRSRLRSRSSHSNIHPYSHSQPSTSTAPTKKPRTQRKKRVKPGAVEDTYEWMCPVPACGRVHVSTFIDGVWGPEKASGKGKAEGARGAIAVFV